MSAAPRHPLNVPGDFYVEDGCCTSCQVVSVEAPGHFDYDGSGHCYVCRQPQEPSEIDRMVGAVHVAEMDCIRYAGTDSAILRKLDAVGARHLCDALRSGPRATAAPTKAGPTRIGLANLLAPGTSGDRDRSDLSSPGAPRKFWRLFTRR